MQAWLPQGWHGWSTQCDAGPSGEGSLGSARPGIAASGLSRRVPAVRSRQLRSRQRSVQQIGSRQRAAVMSDRGAASPVISGSVSAAQGRLGLVSLVLSQRGCASRREDGSQVAARRCRRRTVRHGCEGSHVLARPRSATPFPACRLTSVQARRSQSRHGLARLVGAVPAGLGPSSRGSVMHVRGGRLVYARIVSSPHPMCMVGIATAGFASRRCSRSRGSRRRQSRHGRQAEHVSSRPSGAVFGTPRWLHVSVRQARRAVTRPCLARFCSSGHGRQARLYKARS